MSELFGLAGMVAVITGSTRGIGLAIARVLLGQGANVVVSGIAADELAAAIDALTGRDEYPARQRCRVSGIAGDVTETGFADELVGHALAVFGRLDHVVCNAGVDVVKPAVDYTDAEWDRILAVNLRGVFAPARAAARHWIAVGGPGSITVTSSIAGTVGIPMLAPYTASKGGVDQLVRTLAAEWAPHQIRVNAVAPGYVDHVMMGVGVHGNPLSAQRIRTFTPLGRRATVEEVAAPYAFLASPAASYVTGSILAVDGGYTAI